MPRQPATGQHETIVELLKASKRKTNSLPVRRDFVQLGTIGSPKPGALAGFVKRHDDAGLELFLLHRAMISREPWSSAREAGVWARALGFEEYPQRTKATAVSRIFRRLDEVHNLVDRGRSSRRLEATALHEDGSREPYTMPSTGYFRWPYEYWTADKRWYLELSLPARAVLMIGMSLRPDFILPLTQVKAWYGISDDTVSKGLHELLGHGLIRQRRGKERDWLTGPGWRHEQRFTLQPPFARRPRAGEPVPTSNQNGAADLNEFLTNFGKSEKPRT